MTDSGVTLDQAMRALHALREAAGLPPERFPLPAFIGMLSDEIEALRRAGQPDEAILGLIREASGAAVTLDELREHYAPPGARGRPG